MIWLIARGLRVRRKTKPTYSMTKNWVRNWRNYISKYTRKARFLFIKTELLWFLFLVPGTQLLEK